ncbi:hypothetical protein Bca4012_057935 [Brassica carinata]
MGAPKTFMTFFLLVILGISLSNQIMFTSGAEMEGLSYARCFNSCADETSDEFSLDCIERGYKTGECDAPTGKGTFRCCCDN